MNSYQFGMNGCSVVVLIQQEQYQLRLCLVIIII